MQQLGSRYEALSAAQIQMNMAGDGGVFKNRKLALMVCRWEMEYARMEYWLGIFSDIYKEVVAFYQWGLRSGLQLGCKYRHAYQPPRVVIL